MFHILETWPTKVRWCWLAREYGTSTVSPIASTVLVLCVATHAGWRNPARCGTPCTCALWNTTSPAAPQPRSPAALLPRGSAGRGVGRHLQDIVIVHAYINVILYNHMFSSVFNDIMCDLLHD